MLVSLQVLRGLAAWAVVFHHIVQSYYMGDQKDSFFWALAWKYGGFGVDIFFVLSGIVMALVTEKYRNKSLTFALNRLFRVFPIYWFYSLLLVISIMILPENTYLTWWEDNSLTKSLFLIPNLNPNGLGHFPTLYVGWTLTYEIFFYLFFSSIILMRLPYPAITCAITLALFSIIFRHDNILGNSTTLLLEFSIGILIHEYIKLKPEKLKIATILPILVFTIFSIGMYILEFNIWKYFLAGGIVYLFVISNSFFNKENQLTDFLKNLGDYSYSTYLSHIIVIGWYYALLGNKESDITNTLAIISIIITIHLISKTSFQNIEKNSSIESIKTKLIDTLSITLNKANSQIAKK